MAVTAAQIASTRTTKPVALVCAAHFLNHFYLLLLPPLFPLLREIYGVGYTELGATITVLSLTTGLTQAPVGFLVDRYGARALLVGAVTLLSAAILLVGLLPWYGALLALMVTAGLANAVFHPANYAILNSTVEPAHMGRAFSVHTFAGYLGAAVAPGTILFLASALGPQTALLACGVAGGLVSLLIAFGSGSLRSADSATHRARAARPTPGAQVALLFTLPLILGLLFFAGLSMTVHGIADFGVATLNLNGLSLAAAGSAISAFLFAAPVGVLIGGVVADRVKRHALVGLTCFAVMGVAIAAIALSDPSLVALAALLAIAGLANGIVAPSRDMLIRELAPPGATGKVFGFVSTGYNLGGILAPPLFGYLLDLGRGDGVLWTVVALSVLTAATVIATGAQRRN